MTRMIVLPCVSGWRDRPTVVGWAWFGSAKDERWFFPALRVTSPLLTLPYQLVRPSFLVRSRATINEERNTMGDPQR
jgi:hypothetical protein